MKLKEKGNNMAINSIIEDLKVSREKAAGELTTINQHQVALKSVVDRLDSLIAETGDGASSHISKRTVGKRRGRKPGVKVEKVHLKKVDTGSIQKTPVEAKTPRKCAAKNGPTLTQAAVDVVLSGSGEVQTRDVIDHLVSQKRLDGKDRSVAYAKVHTALKRRSTGEGAPLKSAGKGLWVKA